LDFSFMTNAFARIAWLEDVIRAQLPDINLNSSPNLIVGPAEVAGSALWGDAEHATAAPLLDGHTPNSSTSELQHDSAATPKETTYWQPTIQDHASKRPGATSHGPSSRDSSVEQDTRSVALDLGLLSLNSDSRQLHYVGSSSGSLFASLVQAGANSSKFSRSKATTSSEEIDSALRQGDESAANVNLVNTMKEEISSAYAQLRKVG
jgi:hypothetical protein